MVGAFLRHTPSMMCSCMPSPSVWYVAGCPEKLAHRSAFLSIGLPSRISIISFFCTPLFALFFFVSHFLSAPHRRPHFVPFVALFL